MRINGICMGVALAAALGITGLAASSAQAQSCSGYAITQTTGTVDALGADIGNHADDSVTSITLPFPVMVYGTMYTTANASSNGNLQFTTTATAFTNACLPATTIAGPVIAPHWDDLHTGGTGEGIFVATVGDAPSRVFQVNWFTHFFSGSGTLSFEIRFFEANPGHFEMVYGTVVNNGLSATVGVQSAGAAGSPVTQFSCNTASLSTGLQLNYDCTFLPTNPSGAPTSSPTSATNCGNGTSLLSVLVTPGVNPTSSGLSVAADLTAIGGPSAQQFYDDGTNGDVTAGDNRFSFLATVAAGTSVGAKTMPFVVADAQSRSSGGNLSLSVTACPPPNNACSTAAPISGTGAFAFNNAAATTDGISTTNCTQINKDVWFLWTPASSNGYVINTCATSPAFDTKIAIYAAGTACPGTAATLACNDNSCGTLSSMTVSVVGGQSYLVRVGNTSTSTTVGGPGVLTIDFSSVPPTGVGAANPASVTNCGDAGTLLTVNVTPGANPPSSGLTVVGNLSTIGGSTTQAFFDNGTNGDATAGDNIFSFLATVPAGTAIGAKTLPFTITDAQTRTGTGNISGLTVTACPTGRCCNAGACSVTTQLACTSAGGAWDGTQPGCNLGYTITQGSGAITPGTTDIGNHVDDGITAVALPFPVSLYGASYTTANVCSNGNIQFTTSVTSFSNTCLSTATFTGPTIMPLWDDLYTVDTAGGQGIFSALSGAPGSQTFSLEWRAQYCCTTGAPIMNFQIVFHEGSSSFEVIYGTADRSSATIGVQDGVGGFNQFGCNAGVSAGTMLSFAAQTGAVCPQPCPVDINGDHQVNVADFLGFLALYSAGDPRADMTGDGQINVSDFLRFLALYSAGC